MSDPAVVASKLSLCYSDNVAVDSIDLEIPAGEMHALLGESGSGKTTLLRGIAGFERVTSGELSLHGELVDRAGDRTTFVPPERRRVGVVFQDYALFPHLDVAGNIRFGCSDGDAKIADLLDAVGLRGYDSRDVSELSGGEQQRVALARAIAQDPKLVLLDEPYSNLNRSLRRRLRDQTLEILRGRAVSAIFVTHDRDEAFAVADRISVINDGHLLQTDDPRKLYEAPLTRSVAAAVGDASFLQATFDASVAECVLGKLELLRPATDGLVMIRPEQLRVDCQPDPANVNGTVQTVRFAGAHDEIDVELSSGEQVTCAVDSRVAECGRQVAVSVAGPVVAVQTS